MISIGPFTYLPPALADNPFYPLILKFSRYKTGSFESLFTLEVFLVRYAWIGLCVMFALVLPPLEEVDYLSTLVRLSTLVYPFFFIWSLTRLAGVELMQLVLEGRWTGQLLASSVTNDDLRVGFIFPLWLTLRQYFLITSASLLFYGLETHVLVTDADLPLLGLEPLLRDTGFVFGLFFTVIGWIVFVYMIRLFAEVRLRNGLLKGLVAVALLFGGFLLILLFGLLFLRYPHLTDDLKTIGTLAVFTVTLIALSGLCYWKLTSGFRRYLSGQLDIDVIIYDDIDPHATQWQPANAAPESTARDNS